MAIWGAALKGIYTLTFSCRGLVICCMSIFQAFCFVSSVLTAPYCFVRMNLSNTKFDCTVDLKAFSCLNKSDSFSFGSLCVLLFFLQSITFSNKWTYIAFFYQPWQRTSQCLLFTHSHMLIGPAQSNLRFSVFAHEHFDVQSAGAWDRTTNWRPSPYLSYL